MATCPLPPLPGPYIAAGAHQASTACSTLTGVEPHTNRFWTLTPDHLPRACDPLPFLYQTSGVETRFTNLLDPEPRSRYVFAFHRPEELAAELAGEPAPYPPGHRLHGKLSSLRSRLQLLPPLEVCGLWNVRHRGTRNGTSRKLHNYQKRG